MAAGDQPHLQDGIQALSPDSAVYITVAGTSANSALPENSRMVFISVSTACWVEFGSSAPTVVAETSPAFWLPANSAVIFKVPEGSTHIGAIQDSAGGTLTCLKLN